MINSGQSPKGVDLGEDKKSFDPPQENDVNEFLCANSSFRHKSQRPTQNYGDAHGLTYK